MDEPEPRPAAQRKRDALAILGAHHTDCWVASTTPDDEVAHLVPLSFAWDGEHVVVAVEPRALTTRNILATGRARVAAGGTRDVVMIDVELAETVPVGDGTSAVAERFAAQADWEPRRSTAEYVYLLLRPRRVQVWRESNEIAGRTLMRDGTWLV